MKGITFLSTNFWLPTLPTEVSYHFYKLPFGKLTTLPIEERDYFLNYQVSDCPHCPLKLVIFFIIVLFDKLTTQPTIVSGHFSFQIPFAKCPHCPLVFYGSFKVPFDKLTALPTADGGQISSKYHIPSWPHCPSMFFGKWQIITGQRGQLVKWYFGKKPTNISGQCGHLVVLRKKSDHLGSVVNFPNGTL